MISLSNLSFAQRQHVNVREASMLSSETKAPNRKGALRPFSFLRLPV